MGLRAPVTGTNGHLTIVSDWAELKRRIVATLGPLGVCREFAELGVRFEGNPNAKGKATCHAMDRPDEHPSAFVNTASGFYVSKGGTPETLSLFDFALKYGSAQYGDWLTCIKHFGSITGIAVDGRKDGKGRVLEDTYDYTTADGELLYQVIRYRLPSGKKDFRQRRPDGRGAWIYDLEGVSRVLYGLPILASHAEAIVYIVEGEKDADRLNVEFDRAGLAYAAVATTSAQGAHDTGRWVSYAPALAGRGVVVIADADADGRRHARGVCGFLAESARSVKLIELPDVGAKGDASDWLDQGHTLDDLWAVVLGAPAWDPEAEAVEGEAENDEEPLVGCVANVVPKVVPWLWPGRIPYRFISTFAGRTGLGKSFVTCDIVTRMTRELEWPDRPGECAPGGSVLFITEDLVNYMLAPRLIESGADTSKVYYMLWDVMARYTLADMEMLDRAMRQAHDPTLIVIDPPTNFMGDADEHKNAEVRSVLMGLAAWLEASERDVGCILITHVNKSTGRGIDALSRVLGSVAFTSVARLVHLFAPDTDDPTKRLFVPTKSNVSALAKGLAYRIARTDTLARVEWLGEVETSADEAMDHDRPPAVPDATRAAQWLQAYLADEPKPSDECVCEGNEACKLDRPLYWWRDSILKKRLGGTLEKRGYQGQWFWLLPPAVVAADRNGNEPAF